MHWYTQSTCQPTTFRSDVSVTAERTPSKIKAHECDKVLYMTSQSAVMITYYFNWTSFKSKLVSSLQCVFYPLCFFTMISGLNILLICMLLLSHKHNVLSKAYTVHVLSLWANFLIQMKKLMPQTHSYL